VQYLEVFNTKYFTVEQSTSVYGNGDPYYRIISPSSVICCAINENCDFVLIKQYRHNLEYSTLEFPAGHIEAGESPCDAAKREFLEETGLKADFMYLGSMRLMMNRSFNKEHVFFGIIESKGTVEIQEAGIELVLIERRSFINMIVDGRFEQLAAIGILQTASLRLGVDVFIDNFAQIQEAFMRNLENKRY
jgi:8-oxo-dGTP pyrophosphatase MutT (NUDIX family)